MVTRVFILFLIVVTSCDFAGERHSICNIDYYSSELQSRDIIDSLITLNPPLGKRNQNTYGYNSSTSGFKSKKVFIWYEDVHYVLSITHYSKGNSQRLKVVNFGVDGEILEKYDGLSSKQIETAKEIIQKVLLKELRKYFPRIVFSCDCGGDG